MLRGPGLFEIDFGCYVRLDVVLIIPLSPIPPFLFIVKSDEFVCNNV